MVNFIAASLSFESCPECIEDFFLKHERILKSPSIEFDDSLFSVSSLSYEKLPYAIIR